MNALIVGCGFLGTKVAREIRRVDPSAEVVGTIRTARRHEEMVASGVRPVRLDVLEPSGLDCVDLPPRIVYCVGFDRSSGQTTRSVTVDGLKAFLRALRVRSWSGRFVHVSTTGVFGQTDGSWVDENSPTEPMSDSGRANLLAERLARSVGNLASSTPVTVRLAGLYGPGRVVGRDVIARGEAVRGDPDRWLNLIHVEDAARLVIAALVADAPRALYLGCDNRPVLRREYYETLARRLAVPAPMFAPAGPGVSESDKRVRNRLMREDLGVEPKFADFVAGLDDSLGSA